MTCLILVNNEKKSKNKTKEIVNRPKKKKEQYEEK
jgi:hypothetical protein